MAPESVGAARPAPPPQQMQAPPPREAEPPPPPRDSAEGSQAPEPGKGEVIDVIG